MFDHETNHRVLQVLSNALGSSSRATRLRAVAMLSRIECADRAGWLETALTDSDEGVRHTALMVVGWTLPVSSVPWPDREDPGFDRTPEVSPEAEDELESSVAPNWKWEYSVEVWRADGLLLGVYLAVTCEEDDEHARCIALGQAILASAAPLGDAFESDRAATFITAKRRVRRQVRGGHKPKGLGL